MLEPGEYNFDIYCKDSKDHLYDREGNIVFETTDVAKLFNFLRQNSRQFVMTGPFSVRVD